jgi:putative membrane protein
MAFVKFFHVLAGFMWVGTLLMLTRLMGYHVKENPQTQERLAALYKRMYYFVGMPTMAVALVLGLVLLTQVDWTYRPGWFHMKLLFIVCMVLLDAQCGRFVSRLNEGPDSSRGVQYKIFHGLTGLTLIAILLSLYVVRDRDGEVLHRQELSLQQIAVKQGS